jgi:hypothetical protein
MHRFRIGLVCAIVAATLTGCRTGGEIEQPPVESYVKELTILYGGYTATNRGLPPKTYEDFKKYVVKSLSAGESPKTPAEIDKLLISPRDNQPYKFVMQSDKVAPSTQAPVLYEAVGVDGMRVVAYSLGKIELLNDEQLKAAIPSAK